MTYIALTIALIALALAFVSYRNYNKLQIELVKSRGIIFDLSRGVREIREELKQTRRQVQIVMQQGSDTFRFEKATRVRDAMAMHPDVRDIFAHFHLGGCSSCAINEDDTIEQVAIGHQKDVDLLLTTLNSLFDQEIDARSVPGTGGSGLLTIGMMPDA